MPRGTRIHTYALLFHGYMRFESFTLLLLAVAAANAQAQSTPLALWTSGDMGEVIALDIPFAVYQERRVFYRKAIVSALAGVLSVPRSTLTVTSTQETNAGTTLVYFDCLLQFGSDYTPAESYRAVQEMFCDTPAVAPGSPACPPLVRALKANGLPAAGAYYNDQLQASQWNESLMVDADVVGAGRGYDEGETISIDVPFEDFAVNQQAYSAAFKDAVSSQAGRLVWVTDFQRTTKGNTIVIFDVTSPIVDAGVVGGLFVPPNTVGAPASPALLDALQATGLPVTGAYYRGV
jgi:hypothetical protein